MAASTRTVSAGTTITSEGGQLPGNCTLERALENIINIFHHYSIRVGELDQLNCQELKTLMKEQAPTFLEACGRSNHNYLQKLFKETDINEDGNLSFEEFTIILAKVTDDAHRIIHSEDRCGPDKD